MQLGRRLSKTTVMATCFKSIENGDLTFDFVVELLTEDYSPELIDMSKDLILQCVQRVQKELEFKESVVVCYREIGINILVDKRTVMRALSEYFAKTEMTHVYNVVMAYETVGKK